MLDIVLSFFQIQLIHHDVELQHLAPVADVEDLQLVPRRSSRQLVQVFDAEDAGCAGPGAAAADGCGEDHKSWPGNGEECHQ